MKNNFKMHIKKEIIWSIFFYIKPLWELEIGNSLHDILKYFN